MAARPQDKAPAPRLYLVTPPVGERERFAGDLAAALDAADIAAVLLRLEAADDGSLIDRIEALAPLVQGKGAALVLDGRADLVAQAGADGAHLTGVEQFNAALPALKPARIAGVGGLRTRHEAMLVAEAGADYVMFGEPDQRPAFAAIVERIAWWAEVFQPPCVGYADSIDEVGPLAAAGADFVAVGDFVWRDAGGVVAAVTAAAERLLAAEALG